ncbi:MAG TPA: carbohydrate porin, partial [Rhodocyclaceae bacterium]|nr:carbohydrate porin [Rhodocyclaceae bacterium]
DVSNVRRPNEKRGYGLNLEQRLTADLGLFARRSWNDGQTEMYSYTEVERSAQAGLSLAGGRWGRPDDTFGLALVRNGLSPEHQAYLAAGGTGFLVGDGRLNYRPEQLTEAYYSLAVAKAAWLTFDYQRVANPAYNADRGPVNIYGLRVHTEF